MKLVLRKVEGDERPWKVHNPCMSNLALQVINYPTFSQACGEIRWLLSMYEKLRPQVIKVNV